MNILKEIGIYVHIPFCMKKCYYCDFCSFESSEKLQEEYISALIQEIRASKICTNEQYNKIENDKDYIVKTLYIGGGTPSIINEKYIGRIINELNNKFTFDKDLEATIEVNPGTVTYNKIKYYKEIGINRLSIGLQSTNNRLLKLIGRIHNYSEFETTYQIAREIGFKNINVDLMIGLPGQTIEDVEKSLRCIVEKNPEHISVYSLILEDDTKLKQLIESKDLNLPSDDVERKMYWQVKSILEKNNYKHYEISNFSKANYESRHNTDCWKQKEYLAFGLGAHSYLSNIRFSNTTNIQNYIENIRNRDFEKNINIEEIQNQETKMSEYIILGLRLIKGFNTEDFFKKFNTRFEDIYKKEIQKLTNENLIQICKGNVKLTNKGIDFANIVWGEFI